MRFMAIVLAAGAGTRMKSRLPKVLHPVAGRPMVHWPIHRALAAGADRVVVVVKHDRARVEESVRAAFAGDERVQFRVQGEQDGTAGAVLAARDVFAGYAGDVGILYGDVPNLPQSLLDGLVQHHADAGAPLTVVTAEDPTPNRYGRMVRDAQDRALRIVEHADATAEERALVEVNVGLYMVNASFLGDALDRIGDTNAQAEFYLTDLVSLAAEAGTPAATLRAPDIAPLHGVNSRTELARAESWAQGALRAYWMEQGVTFEAPGTVRLEFGVSLASDVTLAGGVSLLGTTALACGVRVEAGCHLRDTVVGEDTRLRSGTYAEGARIGAACDIGPWAHLRPGTVLEDGVRIGNFVETKNTHMGERSKASHLTYLGDASVGAGANVGAGTITCNYDGVRKHRTEIGAGAFIGSDTQLVAPVRIGEGAFVGAGTTVTRDVPPGALAVTRVPQRNVEDWVRRRSARETDGEST